MPESINRLLEKLTKAFGQENVFTSAEHLYVYSRSGSFGVKPLGEPLAVVKIDSDTDYRRLLKMLDGTDIKSIRNDMRLNKSMDIPGKPFILLDVQKPLTIEELERNLSELSEKSSTNKKNLIEAPSFQHWASIHLQARDGFQLSKTGEDTGFCVVHSYFNYVQTYSSKGRLLLAKGLLNGDLDPSGLLIDSLYSCTACGQCYDQISLGTLEINNAIIKARNQVALKGCEPKRFGKALENITQFGNPMGLPTEDRSLWIEEAVERHPFEDNPVLYWPGCVTSYRLPNLVESTCSIMEKAGYDFGLLGSNEGCCGLVLYLSGHWDEAAKNGHEILKSLGSVKRLVTNCAGCYYNFSRVLSRLGLKVPFEVLHTSQLIKESVNDGRLRLKENGGCYTWHDPCDLGRHCNVYEPPRNVLNSIPGLTLLEPRLNREHTVCCGAGGGLWMYNEDVTNHVSHQKLSEATPKDIEGIVTGCPTCLLSLRNSARRDNRNLKVLDLVEIVDSCT